MVGTVSGVERWTDAALDRMRSVGDEAADTAIALWIDQSPARPDPRALAHLAEELVGFRSSEETDNVIKLLLVQQPQLALRIDPCTVPGHFTCCAHDLELAHKMFRKHGLKILMTLVFYSLPAAYAAHNGVRVLHSKNGSTGYLVKDLNRRLIETTQFVLEVFAPGGLDVSPTGSVSKHGLAVQAALRVRLLHAAVRALILQHKPSWDRSRFGLPANQEDTAGTLMTFSLLVIDGLRKLSLDIDPAEEQAFLNVWRSVGRLLGVDESLIPVTVDEAETLKDRIKERQIDAPILRNEPNEQGVEMTRHLLDFIRQSLPWPLRVFRRLPASVMRFYLPRAPVDVPRSLGVPRTPGLAELVRLWFFIDARITKDKIFNLVNQRIYTSWGATGTDVDSLLQFSRFFNKRMVGAIRRMDRNVPLVVPKAKEGESHIDLFGWDETWGFSQAGPIVRGARWVSSRMRASS